ncbi:unnamed protein product [Didymodactylos carnosus]|uniref:Uncharacterized protein n=1 Tax=Didymodactylos carnosus TaxID=1234261 RepID=A0A8S2LEY9_9BILA|nr:unnamed protein product [Didymodactylos carnosus]CAF3887748.1 unnamed protein product [Didymodactylos carnosus]
MTENPLTLTDLFHKFIRMTVKTTVTEHEPNIKQHRHYHHHHRDKIPHNHHRDKQNQPPPGPSTHTYAKNQQLNNSINNSRRRLIPSRYRRRLSSVGYCSVSPLQKSDSKDDNGLQDTQESTTNTADISMENVSKSLKNRKH